MMNRFDRMAGRVAFYVLAKERPDDMFGAAFFDLRLKVKDLKEKWSQQAKDFLQATLLKDLKDSGLEVLSVDVSLGKYKGSRFVTSAKVKVVIGTDKRAKELAAYLQKYSPKYVLKSFDPDTKAAEYNIR